MSVKTVATTVALLAGAVLAQDCGQAVVVNGCSQPVYVFNTPAEGGGQQQITRTLETNETYSQPWTTLSNGMGWSIKLSKSETNLDNIMQYEYTYHEDGVIWYDLSDVNGNPWEGDWMIDASGSDTCDPKQRAYCYSTDDAYGMQACSSEAVITVTLCAVAEEGNDACHSGSVSAAPTSYSAPAPSSYEAPSSSTFSTPSQSAPQWMTPHTWNAVTPTTTSEAEAPSSTYVAPPAPTSEEAAYVEPSSSSAYVAPTTFATSSAPVISSAPFEVIVTDTAVDVVTQIVTATAWAKRHEHHPRHPHNRA